MSKSFKEKMKETIDFVNNQLLKLAKAEERLDNK